jgi:hypothetical protein
MACRLSRFWPVSLACCVSTLALSCAQLLGDVEFDEKRKAAALPDTGSANGGSIPQVDLGDPSSGAPVSDPMTAAAAAPDSTADEDKAGGCEPGSFRCSDAALEYCIDAAWVAWQSCGSAALCESTPAGRCLPAACALGEFRCNGATLEQCNDTATGWAETDECISAAHCDAIAQACTPAPCVPEGARCNGDTVEVCSEDQLGWEVYETCASPGLCQNRLEQGTAVCLAPACAPEQYRCQEDGTLQACAPDQTGFINFARCESASACDASAGRCTASADVPGANTGPGGAAFPSTQPSAGGNGDDGSAPTNVDRSSSTPQSSSGASNDDGASSDRGDAESGGDDGRDRAEPPNDEGERGSSDVDDRTASTDERGSQDGDSDGNSDGNADERTNVDEGGRGGSDGDDRGQSGDEGEGRSGDGEDRGGSDDDRRGDNGSDRGAEGDGNGDRGDSNDDRGDGNGDRGNGNGDRGGGNGGERRG